MATGSAASAEMIRSARNGQRSFLRWRRSREERSREPLRGRQPRIHFEPQWEIPARVTTNALGHQETREYDHRFGAMTKLTGPNGLVTRWEYDDLGRKTKEIRADGSETVWQYLPCGTCAPENLGKYWLTTYPTDSPPVTTVHDVLGREVLWATFGFNGQGISKETRYDAQGNVLKGSRKYFQVGGTALWTNFLYDKLGRVTRETGPDGSRVDTLYDKLCTTATAFKDAVSPGQVTKRCRNTQDQIVSVVDAQQQTTTYEHDAFGNLVKTVDAHGHQTVMKYDLRGRKIEMIDPDLGKWTYVYDSLGQLLEQESPEERDAQTKTVMTYDKLGRMLTRTDAGEAS
jgi:YD repeat-containing protein